MIRPESSQPRILGRRRPGRYKSIPCPSVGCLLGGAWLAVVATFARAQGEIFTGVTLFQEGTEVNLRYVHRQSRTQDAEGVEDLHERREGLLLNASYGLASDFTLGLTVPVLFQRQSFGLSTGEHQRAENDGIGDIAFSLKYRLSRWDGVQRSRQVAVVGGLEFPTGDTDQKGLGFRIGSGSFDPFVGLGWSEGWQYWDFNASAFYQLNTEGTRDIERGDILVLGTEVDYYPIRKAFPGPEMFVGLQVFWEHEFRERVDGDPVRDSGGNRIFFGPLVGYSPRPDLVLDLALFLPVLQDLNGDQLEDSWILSAGVRYRF